MTNFYGQYIGFGAGVSAAAAPGMHGSRGFSIGGHGKTSIDVYNIASLGNATDFGDQLGSYSGAGGTCSNITRGIYSGAGSTNVIEYINCASAGDGTDFGDKRTATSAPFGVSNGIRGIMAGSITSTGETEIDYITIAAPDGGNAAEFGDLLDGRGMGGRGEDATRGIFMGGSHDDNTGENTISYVTTATLGNATDFSGDRTVAYAFSGGCGGNGKAVTFGGQLNQVAMDYVTIQSLGDADTFGNLTTGGRGVDGCSNETRGTRVGGVSNQTTIDYWAMATPGDAGTFGNLNDGKQYNGSLSGVGL